MEINRKIEKMCFQRGWSMYELAQEAGLTQSTLTSIMKRGTPPKIDTLQCICDAFGVSLSQFFFEDEQQEVLRQDEKLLVELYRKLPYHKQQSLLTLLDR